MNDLLIVKNGEPLAPSDLIASNTMNDHKSVLQLIRTYISDFEEFGGVTFEMRPFETAGGEQERSIAMLNEQQATLLLTYLRNNAVVRTFKVRLVKAFYALKQETAPATFEIPKTLSAALRLAADQADTIDRQQATIAYQAPKVEALARIADADGSMCIRDAAKTLQMRPIDLTNWLKENKWIYQRPGKGSWLAYQDRIQSGHMEHKVTTVERGDGSEKAVDQARVTAKGLTKLAELIQAAA